MAVNNAQGISILLGTGEGATPFSAGTPIVLANAGCLVTGDLNGDGRPDVVLTNNAVPYNDVFVLLNNQPGGFTQVPTNFGAQTFQPILADLNRDGNLDLVVGVEVYLGNGMGGFTYQTSVPPPAGTVLGITCMADVNGDGIPDIFVRGYDTLAVYLGEEGVTYATPFDLLVENLHGQSLKEGLPDIVAPDGSGGVMVLLNLTK